MGGARGLKLCGGPSLGQVKNSPIDGPSIAKGIEELAVVEMSIFEPIFWKFLGSNIFCGRGPGAETMWGAFLGPS